LIIIRSIIQEILSSAGMVLLYLKEKNNIDTKLYGFFNQSLILGVDAQ